MQNKCQLITYPDSFGGSLAELGKLLGEHFEGAFGGIHLLPFYPSSGDRGFAPIHYDTVDAAFGTWKDIDALGRKYDLIVDFMINHISRRSPYFLDYLTRGSSSPFADLFIRFSRLPLRGEALDAALSKIFRRKPDPPWLHVKLSDGSEDDVWCTFGEEQIDLNVDSAIGKEMVRSWLLALVTHPIKMVRLDAFAHVIKRLGTSCFFVEPETTALLREIAGLLEPFGVEVLPEIHERHSIQLSLSRNGFWTYDFNLPLLVLQAFYDQVNTNLYSWLRICPRKQVTTLDTHDGLPVLDVMDLLSLEEIERTKTTLFSTGANVQERYSKDLQYGNRNLYQLNCTYYSALGNDDEAYIAARAIQFFTPGIPQVYYMGLLAGENDVKLVEKTKLGRNINRHNYTRGEIAARMERPAVQRLKRLMEFRNEYDAFNGQFHILDAPHDEVALEWVNDTTRAELHVNLRARSATIRYADTDGRIRPLRL